MHRALSGNNSAEFKIEYRNGTENLKQIPAPPRFDSRSRSCQPTDKSLPMGLDESQADYLQSAHRDSHPRSTVRDPARESDGSVRHNGERC